MTKRNPAQLAVALTKQTVDSYFASFKAPSTAKIEFLASIAELEVRLEQARQQELANMIALAANPSACPLPIQDVLARIKELTNLSG
jgi:DNA-binding protein H-NS